MVRSATFFVATMLVVATAVLAGPIKPPSVVLVAPQHHVSVVTVESLDLDAATSMARLHVRLLTALHGQNTQGEPSPTALSDTVIVLRLDADVAAAPDAYPTRPGQTVIVGWTDAIVDRLARGVYKRDPEGARLVSLPGLGPALWVATPTLRGYIAASASGRPEAVRTSVLDLLETQSVAERRLAAVELALDPALLHHAADAERTRFAAALQDVDPARETDAARFLLDAVVLARRVPSPAALALARRALESVGPAVDPASSGPGLLVRAAGLLAERPARGDVRRLTPHTASAHPSVASAAWDAFFAIDPGKARKRAQRALDRHATDGDALSADLATQLASQLERLLVEGR